MESNRTHIPYHVAIIMDGNGRWANARGMPRVMGHRSGMNNVQHIALEAQRIGIQALTLYTFSTENWNRSMEEVQLLMRLPQEFLPIVLEDLLSNNVRISMIGSRDGVPEDTLRAVDEAIVRTARNDGLLLTFALNYGGRQEIVHAAQRWAQAHGIGTPCDEQTFASFFPSAQLPPLDLLIRTGGEMRLSNFMLWQSAYAELWFTDVYWPDFSPDDLHQAVSSYQMRQRRYGSVVP